MKEKFFVFGIPGGVPMTSFRDKLELTITFNISAKQRGDFTGHPDYFALRDFVGTFTMKGNFAGLPVDSTFDLTNDYFSRPSFNTSTPSWIDENDIVGRVQEVVGTRYATLFFNYLNPVYETLIFNNGELDFRLNGLVGYPQGHNILRLVNRTGGVISGSEFLDASWSFDVVGEVAERHTLISRCYGTKQQ